MQPVNQLEPTGAFPPVEGQEHGGRQQQVGQAHQEGKTAHYPVAPQENQYRQRADSGQKDGQAEHSGKGKHFLLSRAHAENQVAQQDEHRSQDNYRAIELHLAGL